MQATPKTDAVSPVAVADLAAVLGVPDTDPLLAGYLQAATDAVINHIRLDLTPRRWVGVVPPDPGYPLSLSTPTAPMRTFELPYTALVDVDSVSTEYTELDYIVTPSTRPARVTVQNWDGLTELTIEYRAGMATIPAAIKTAIIMAASFMYEHRGGCDGDGALSKSGATGLLKRYRVETL